MGKSAKSEVTRYLLSSLVTFIATFLVVLGNWMIVLDEAALTSLTWSVLGAAILVAARAAVKVAFERLVRK